MPGQKFTLLYFEIKIIHKATTVALRIILHYNIQLKMLFSTLSYSEQLPPLPPFGQASDHKVSCTLR